MEYRSDQNIETKYKLKTILGKGEFGKVYKAEKDGKDIALKVIEYKTQEQLFTVKKEISMLKELNCLPSLVCYYDSEISDDKIYIEMEYISGKDLRRFGKEYRNDKNLIMYMFSIMSDLMKGITYIHEKNIIHRDIKPTNIMIKYPEKQPKLIDFGLACTSLNYERCKGQKCCLGKSGTPFFMPPETLLQGLSFTSSDLWSLAASIYTSITGLTVFQPKPENLSRLKIESTKAPELISTTNNPLDNLLEKMLNKDYEERPNSSYVTKYLEDYKNL